MPLHDGDIQVPAGYGGYGQGFTRRDRKSTFKLGLRLKNKQEAASTVAACEGKHVVGVCDVSAIRSQTRFAAPYVVVAVRAKGVRIHVSDKSRTAPHPSPSPGTEPARFAIIDRS